jgi:photosystem II stability/assembly factor-like uncharacterized protein
MEKLFLLAPRPMIYSARSRRAFLRVIALSTLGAGVVAAQTPSSSTTDALRFRTIGSAAMSGRFVDLAVYEAQPHVFYAASSTGGLYKTTNNGVSFTALFNNEATHSIGAIALNQRDTSIVWLGTGERANRQSSSWGDGVYKSTDGGATWRNVGLKASAHIGRIVLHPTDANRVFVAAIGQLWGPNPERGLYRTTDGGNTWQQVLKVDENTGVTDVAMHPSNPNVLYAASYQRRRTAFGFNGGGPGSALWKSTDGGDTWQKLTSGLPAGEYGRIGIAIYAKDPNIVYASIEQGLRYTASTAYEEPLAGLYRSMNAGASWEQMSTWNPRPMYASQIIVDPNDHCTIYMMNFFSTSSDCGKTSRSLRQTLHGDDRFMWVNPANSNHLIKADDGGIGISYDKARTWLYVSNLSVSQWYRVSFDMKKPYNVYGGLQDNGSWSGPSATYRSEGITNADWIKWGGGDGFFNLVDTTDNRTLYTNSQFLGLSRVDMLTGERTDIRPGDPQGAISGRRNWTTWGDMNAPAQTLGNAMAPANWDAPILISHHNTHTIYAGTNILWKSTDRGNNWTALGDRTTGVDRRSLPIMGQPPRANTLSLDDGVPYWPAVSAIAESPRVRDVLWVGTDDGNIQRSSDGGKNWTEFAGKLPGLPRNAWINGIETSRHADARAYVVANNYKNGDFANYVYRTDDNGASWQRIDGGLPANRVARTLREDLVNADVLYLGTEIGLFWSNDRGATWAELKGGMPTMAFNDLFIHPREHDLVVGTHSRGIWILDNVRALRELTPAVAAKPVHVFSTRPAEQIRYRGELGHVGDMFYNGENPSEGAIIDFHLTQAGAVEMQFVSARGATVATMRVDGKVGVNRAMWNMAYAAPNADATRAPMGPPVEPGMYTVRVTAGGATATAPLEVRDDPRSTVAASVREEWTKSLLDLQTLRTSVQALATRVNTASRGASAARVSELADARRQITELNSRVSRLYGEVRGSVQPLTGQQRSQREYYERMVRELTAALARLGAV